MEGKYREAILEEGSKTFRLLPNMGRFFFFLSHLVREKVLEDDELENKDLDIKSEEIEEGAFENNNL